MLTTHDIGNLFAAFRTAYGAQWRFGSDAIPTWRSALVKFTPNDIQRAANEAIKHHVDYPPSLPQFLDIVRDSVPKLTSGQAGENMALAERVYSYTKPMNARNPKGNPNHISLPESVAQRQAGESAEDYRKRTSDAVTFAMYPQLGPDGLYKHGF